jgi:hypothetical protein
MSAVATTQVKDVIIWREIQHAREQIHFFSSDVDIVHNICVRFQIERVEDTTPPVRFHMLFQVGDGSKEFSESLLVPSLGRSATLHLPTPPPKRFSLPKNYSHHHYNSTARFIN